MNHHHFEGKDIPHIKLDSKTTVKELVEIYADSFSVNSIFVLNEFNETDSPAKFCSRHASISCNTELSLCVSIEIGMSIEISVWLKKYAEDENPIIATMIIIIGNIFSMSKLKNNAF